MKIVNKGERTGFLSVVDEINKGWLYDNFRERSGNKIKFDDDYLNSDELNEVNNEIKKFVIHLDECICKNKCVLIELLYDSLYENISCYFPREEVSSDDSDDE